ncbi:thiosulfate sulfurtransferase [Pyrrhoderma noxium]|uniref:Thiosulfate sulfurtransferase n=1 Tax=Pyrrhoderma noxium TaxID=2282107 RepID=A0A286UQG3_9AGAM|nr:thiosulfate sulfurtransferase [Pyrrhoderma noxium]
MSSSASYLITPQALQASLSGEINRSSRAPVVLDVSWFMPNSPRDARSEYTKKSIPSARLLDLDELSSSHELGLKHMMPSPEQFASTCEDFGITRDTHVIMYDSQGIFSAPRALFMFRAFGHANSSVLDGGLPRWEAEGFSTEPGSIALLSKPEKASYPTPSYDKGVVKSYDQIVANAALDPESDPSASLVVDARPNGRFTGQDPEPRPGLSAGHIPYSLSLPFTTFLETHQAPNGQSYTSFLPKDKILEALEGKIGAKNTQDVLEGKRSIVASCGSGMTAGVLWLGLSILGVKSPAIYDESWTGYAMRESSKIVKD